MIPRICATLLFTLAASSVQGQSAYQVKPGHPRLLIGDVRELVLNNIKILFEGPPDARVLLDDFEITE